VGAAARTRFLSHAAGRLTAHSDVARLALNAFGRDASGATAIEYAMIAGLISIAIITATTTIGTTLSTFFVTLAAAI
jgi:pilus assembly protein Flp/PilA